MELLKLQCPYCKGNLSLEIDESINTCYCPYCRQQIFIDDGVKRININKNETYTYRDEARIREIEYAEQERRRREQKRLQQRKEQEYLEWELSEKKRRWKIYVAAWYGFVIVYFLVLNLLKSTLSENVLSGVKAFGALVISLPLFVFPSIYPRNEQEKNTPVKTWIKWFFILYLIMGMVGALEIVAISLITG